MVIPTDGLIITKDTVLSKGVYYLPNGIQIEGNGITLDGNDAILIGENRKGKGIYVSAYENIIIKNICILEYYHGIIAQNCNNLTITNCIIRSTHELDAYSVFLDIWLTAQKAYGGGILLHDVRNCLISGNNLSHQMNGLLTYQCEHLTVKNNLANYCSGWGYHLYETCESVFENNSADFCCRYQPRGDHKGHMGADSAGFLIVFRSCNNIFHHNNARMSGDGFFLAGMTPQFEPVGCNNNIFEENDGSYSPNIAFEATFSKHNIYINNCANNSNYGFWLGFSSNAILENNQIIGNRQAGIATENGINFIVRNNKFINNQHGILLWSKHIPDFDNGVSENITSCQWLIEENTFAVNHKAIRIAANQDHGIHPLPESGEFGLPAPQPYGHIIRKNHFEDNDHNIELFQTIDTLFETENNPNELSNYSDER